MIVIFNGPPGSGKDECALYFCRKGHKHLSFKHQLFKETVKLFGVSMEWFMNGYDNREVKERKEKKLRNMSRREAMIYTSEDYIKPRYGKSFFGDQVSSVIDRQKDYVISDGGFIEELQPLINKVRDNIVFVQLTRKNCTYASDSRRYFNGILIKEYIAGEQTPIEEDFVLRDRLSVPTFRINNNGSIKELHTILEEFLYTDLVEIKRRKENERRRHH